VRSILFGMAKDFLTAFLGNKNRARIVRIFVLSPLETFTVDNAAKRADVPLDSAVKEIRDLEEIGVLKKGRVTITLANNSRRVIRAKQQKKNTWLFNQDFKYARPLSSFVHEIDPVRHREITEALKHSGKVVVIILSGSFMGDPTRPVDIIVAGDPLNESRLERAIRALEPQFGREIRYAAFSTPEFRYRLTIQDRLLRDTLDYPHLVLLDKVQLL